MWHRRGSIAILLVLVNVIACGCNYSKSRADGGTGGTAEQSPSLKVRDNIPPQLVVEKTAYDFDKMDQDKKGSHLFEIRNEGKGELSLRIQHTSCGCTSVKLEDVEWDPAHPAPKTIVTVPPGGKADVEMTWDTKERTGEFNTSANIESNDPKLRVVTFSVKGQVIPSIEVTQTQVRMEQVRNGEVTTAYTYVYSKRFDDLQLTEFKTSNPLVTAEFGPAETALLESMKATSGVKVTIKVQPGMPLGTFAASLTLMTNKEERSEVAVSISGQVLGGVLISPYDDVAFGSISVSEEKTIKRFVKVIADDPMEVTVGKVTVKRWDPTAKEHGTPVESEILKVNLTQMPTRKNQWQLVVHLPKGSPGGQFKGVIELETTHPTAKIVKIPVRFDVTK